MRYHTKYRILEMLPGIFIWSTLVGVVLLSLLKPLWAIYFIIAFDIYWLLRVSYMLIYIFISWHHFRRDKKIDWLERVKNLSDKNWRDYHHLIFLPTYKEPIEIIRRTLKAIADTNYTNDRYMIVLAGEERDKENFEKIAATIQNEFGKTFYKLFITLHPSNLPGEMAGKGSNMNYSGHIVKREVDKLELDYRKVIVSTFDVDTIVHKQYFAYLTHRYLTHPNPTRASFQPIAVYNNNLWESNPVIRVVSSSTTFWLFTDLARPERLFTFSSHSMSFQALVDVGFWDKTIVTEDSRIFLQCFVRYDGHYSVVPLYIPVFMNTVDIGRPWRSLVNQYKQMRRWAWGAEHFPWMIDQFWGRFKNPRIPFRKKLRYVWNQAEGMYSWATAPLLILIVGYLPLRIAQNSHENSALFQNAPHILETLMRLSMVGLIVIAIMYTLMLPKRPHNVARYHYLIILAQWIMVPFTMILFGSIPAIDAQTRLMLGGKYRLGFWVTEKN